jgi:hypothetical protein
VNHIDVSHERARQAAGRDILDPMRSIVAILTLGLWAACGSVSETKMDASSIDTPVACVPETDAELCTAAAGCEQRTFTDKCGMSREVDCGTCTGGMGCVVGTCKTPLCTTFNYQVANFPNMSRSGVEDSIGGATPDAQVILYVQTAGTTGCGNYHLVVADEVTPGSGTYTQRDVSATFTTLGLFNGQDGYTITADGLTIVAMTADRKAFKATKRSAINMVDFGTASDADFVNINQQTMGNSDVFRSPTLSADGLEFWYSVLRTGAPEVPYYSVRTSTSVPFPAPTAAPAPVSTSTTPSGISADRLALFIWDGSFQGKVFTRASTSDPFTNPNAPAAPPTLTGWAQRPIANCTKLVGMTSTGGCANEDVIVLTRQ